MYFTIPQGFWSWTREQRRAWLGAVANSAASQLKPTTTRYHFFRYDRSIGRYPADTHAPTEILSIAGRWRLFAVTPDQRSMPISTDEAQRLAGPDRDLYAATSSPRVPAHR